MSRPAAYLVACLSVAVIAWLGSGTAAAGQQWGPYPAEITRIKDGDTFVGLIQTFPGEYSLRTLRLGRSNTPENPGQCDAETALAERATRRFTELSGGVGATVMVTVRDVDSFGRPLARVRAGGRDVGQTLIDEGLAREYADGQWRDGFWCPSLNQQDEKG